MKNIVKYVTFLLMVIGIYNIIAFFVVDTGSLNRLKYNEFYNTKDLDIIAVGPSSTLNGFFPMVADKILGQSTFNMGTASQEMAGTYYQVKEILRCQDVDTIILDVCFPILLREVGGETATQIMTDYMRGINKITYIVDTMPKSKWLTMFSRVYREHDASKEHISNNLKAKSCMEYWQYKNQNEFYTNYNTYYGKGYSELKKDNLGFDYFMYHKDDGIFDSVDKEINEEMMQYLQKTVQLCKDNNVNIILVSYPFSRLHIKKSGDYNRMHQFIQEFADSNKIPYYDLNMIEDAKWEDFYFANADHCSIEGAKRATEYICKLLQGEKVEFCTNIEETYARDIIGILYDEELYDTGRMKLSWEIITDKNKELYYRILSDTCEYDSGYVYDNFVILDAEIDDIVLEIYDYETNEYIGNAKKIG